MPFANNLGAAVPNSIAQPTNDVYVAFLEILFDYANYKMASNKNLNVRCKWLVFNQNNILDPVNTSLVFDTGFVLNDIYSTALREGRLADTMVTRIQIDNLSMLERAYRARHTTTLRCHAHSTARLQGQGGQASTFAAQVDHLSQIISAGYSDNGGGVI